MSAPQPHRASEAADAERGTASIVPDGTRGRWPPDPGFAAPGEREPAFIDDDDRTTPVCEREPVGRAQLAEEERNILQYLGAALIMQWTTLPRKLQRELFDNAGSMDQLLDASALRGQIARFLHKHKDDDDKPTQAIRSVD